MSFFCESALPSLFHLIVAPAVPTLPGVERKLLGDELEVDFAFVGAAVPDVFAALKTPQEELVLGGRPRRGARHALREGSATSTNDPAHTAYEA